MTQRSSIASAALFAWIALGMGCAPESASAEEYFGEFLGELVGKLLRAEPRPVFELSAEFAFQDPNGLKWSVPSGVQVDGASIPQPFWSWIGGPFSGAYIQASVIHDRYCRTMERTAHDTHRNFYYGMRAAGVESWRATLMYWAVNTFGPQWTIEKRLEHVASCDDQGNCSATPTFVDVAVRAPDVAFDDTTSVAVAYAKAMSIARTLKTTDGASLDVSSEGVVAASLDAVDASAAAYRKMFITKSFREDPESLGLLSAWRVGSLNDVAVFAGGRLPTIDATTAPNWTPQVVAPDSVFRLEDAGDLRGYAEQEFRLQDQPYLLQLPERTSETQGVF